MVTSCATPAQPRLFGALGRYGEAPYYRTQPPRGHAVTAAHQLFEGAVPATVRERLRHDARLDAVARVQLDGSGPGGKKLPAAVTRWLLWRVGCPAESFRSIVETGQSLVELDARLVAAAAGLNPEEPVPLSYGLARAEGPVGASVQSLVLVARALELMAVPKKAAPGGRVVVAGQMAVPVEKLTIGFALEAHPLESNPSVPVAADGRFAAEVVAPRAAGRHFLRLFARLASGRGSQTDLPLFVDIRESEAPDPVFGSAEESDALRAQLNELRAARGEEPLDPDTRLDAQAREAADAICAGANLGAREITRDTLGYAIARSARVEIVRTRGRHLVNVPRSLGLPNASMMAAASCAMKQDPGSRIYVFIVAAPVVEQDFERE